MAAVFPRSIKAFSTKRNLLDDVDASDINAMQEEIVALESVLGVLLTDFEDLEAEFEESEEEQEGLEDQLARNRLRFQSLRERLDYIQNGRHQPACQLTKTDFMVGNTQALETSMPPRVDFPKPPASLDPNKMFNGVGITLRKGGWWRISGHALYGLRNPPATANKGVYVAAIGINGTHHTRGMDRQIPTLDNNRYWNPSLNPYVEGHFDRGTRITLRTTQSSDRAQQHVIRAYLTASWVRRMD